MITLCNPLYCWSGDSHWQGQSVGHPFSFFQTSAFRWGPLQAASWHVGQFKAGHREKVFPETLAAKHLWLRRQLHVLCRFSRHCRRRTRSSCATWKCFKWFEHPLTSGCTGGELSWELCFWKTASLCRCDTLHSLQSEERLLWNGRCQTRHTLHLRLKSCYVMNGLDFAVYTVQPQFAFVSSVSMTLTPKAWYKADLWVLSESS